MLEKLPEYRKGLIAVLAAALTVAHLVGFPLADDVDEKIVALFDAVAALLVVRVPNRPT